MNRVVFTIVAVAVAAILLRLSVFIVDQRQFAIVFELGQIVRVIGEPGLHFKMPPPFQNIETVDKRILTIDSAAADRVQTSEKKNLLIDSFVKWRITDARAYWVSFQGSERAAEERMSTLVRDAMNQAVNKRTVEEITSRGREKAMEEIRAAVQARVKDLGVTIVDVRLRRVDFVPEILTESVYPRMVAERKRVANEQRSIGAAEAEKIKADADRQREVLLAQAYREAQRVKGEGDAKAAAIYARAFGANPEFYSFYRSLDAYRQSFKSRSDTLIVDPSSEFFRYIKNSSGSGGAH
ncbi:MAG TPA: protease modulator HflC [Burkholderiaceae bacterium]|nr:protease modulator HflC [Burkholderiaceae bacterium]